MNDIEKQTIDDFRKVYGSVPDCVAFAPGRVEILGNHTDYNGGFVLSVALDLGIALAAEVRPGPPVFEVRSDGFRDSVQFSLAELRREDRSWANYPKGVIQELERSGVRLRAARMLIGSNLPQGAGVSSSAALELATAEACYAMFGGKPAKPMDEAILCQRAERSFVGVPCGLLDQFSSLFGKKDHVLFLDCSTLRYSQVPLGRDDIRVVLADSGEKHALVDGQYARLRESCERARDALARVLPAEVRSLRDVRAEDLERHAVDVDPEDLPRATHVVRENERVLRGLAAFKSRHYPEIRKLMLESHASSRDLFGNSTEALDFLVDAAAELPGFLGGKLTGGGFGGSTVNLVEAASVGPFVEELGSRFAQRFGRGLRTLVCGIGDGARALRVERGS